MAKQLVGNVGTYSFVASTKTITITNTAFNNLPPEKILLIWNASTGQIIYNPADPNLLAAITYPSANNVQIVPNVTFTGTPTDSDSLMITVWLADNISPSVFQIKGITGNIADVSNSRLLVSSETPPAGPGETAESRTDLISHAGTDDDIYVIPNGDTLRIDTFVGGVEDNGAGAQFVLYDDPTGTGSPLIPVPQSPILINGNTRQNSINSLYAGDGTRAIRMRSEQLTGGTYNIVKSWQGVLF